MAQEMVPYTETRRDRVEQELAAMANKRELLERKNNGIQVIAYYLVAENVTTIWVRDERTNSAAEFQVPPAEVMDWFQHPFAHKDAVFPAYKQADNNE